ncbi:MAG: hypothetical protein M3319_14545 [Actinomycetota bacterium]|jgi:hypothetical protein|nr:hypothetical protein [Actinomycetota bacterium]
MPSASFLTNRACSWPATRLPMTSAGSLGTDAGAKVILISSSSDLATGLPEDRIVVLIEASKALKDVGHRLLSLAQLRHPLHGQAINQVRTAACPLLTSVIGFRLQLLLEVLHLCPHLLKLSPQAGLRLTEAIDDFPITDRVGLVVLDTQRRSPAVDLAFLFTELC